MNKISALVLMCLIIASPLTILYADVGVTTPAPTAKTDVATKQQDIATYRLAVGEKAARGGKNLIFGWTELPKRIVDVTKETKNPIWGVVVGGFQGVLKAMARTASGASDVITAPLTPEKDPLIRPDINVE